MRHRGRDPVNLMLLALAAIGTISLAVAAVAAWARWVEPEQVRLWAPTASAVIASAGLLLTAWTYNRATQRQRLERTMHAWHAYRSATSKLIRRQLATGEGEPKPVELPEVSELLAVRGRTVTSAKDAKEKALIIRVHELAAILNHLERLAVGCRHGLYDREHLYLLGHGPITRTHAHLEQFVNGARTVQPTSYVETTQLVRWLAARRAEDAHGA
ncbi:hypothetical protein NODU109028_02735 [Nocardioides dubius]|uniref:DUF4760 domain-containing protein n=1 Tax=Nocardioides dubius TaxID=317019 RepID=A0ABN1TQK6_9ACTN